MISAQVGEAADEAEHALKDIRPLPRRIERRVPAGARAGDRAVIWIVREVVEVRYFGQNLFCEEGRKARPDGVIFRAAIEARLCIRSGARDYAGIDEHAD